MRHVLVAVGATLLLTSCQSVERGGGAVAGPLASPCASSQESEKVAHVIRSFYSALSKDDFAAVEGLTTRSFHAFEIGKRYTGPELTKLIADAHKAGRFYQWAIGPIESRVDCQVASANWENTGAAGTAQKMEPRAWLESATLVKEGDRWLIDFLHSTPKDPRK